jgi:hypothetical protein
MFPGPKLKKMGEGCSCPKIKKKVAPEFKKN